MIGQNLLHDTFGEAANLVLTVIHFKNEYIRIQNSLKKYATSGGYRSF